MSGAGQTGIYAITRFDNGSHCFSRFSACTGKKQSKTHSLSLQIQKWKKERKKNRAKESSLNLTTERDWAIANGNNTSANGSSSLSPRPPLPLLFFPSPNTSSLSLCSSPSQAAWPALPPQSLLPLQPLPPVLRCRLNLSRYSFSHISCFFLCVCEEFCRTGHMRCCGVFWCSFTCYILFPMEKYCPNWRISDV